VESVMLIGRNHKQDLSPKRSIITH